MTKKLAPEDKLPENRTDTDARELGDGTGYSFGRGLYLKVAGGSRLWFVNPAIAGKRTKLYFGSVGELSVEKAREKAAAMIKQVRHNPGVDPRRQAPEAEPTATPTFRQAADTFMARTLPKLKNKNHQDKWRSSIANHCGPILALPVDTITRADVLKVLDPIWDKIPVQAAELRGRIERILGDAYTRLDLERENPALWQNRLENSLSPPPRSGETRGAHPSIAPDAMPDFIGRLRTWTRPTARALEFTILTCLRTQEVIAMRRHELDLDKAIWTVPNVRFKVDNHGYDFVVPLAPRAVAILRAQIAHLEETFGRCDYIWPGTPQGQKKAGKKVAPPHISNATMLSFLQKDMQETDAKGRLATVHGFRASFKTWAGDQLRDDGSRKFDHDVVELCLAHNPGTEAERAYRRSTLLAARQPVMLAWADYLTPPPVAAAGTDKVVRLRKAG
ncbi:MAG TPA: site-specific integrase [Xanthobacteraceae bacterium]|nr:site-specific integrase [Xanthobacteraceae bacterium]